MRKRYITSLIVLVCALAGVSATRGQSTREEFSPNVPAANELDPLELLPASDFIADINVRRAFTEVIPRLLAKSPSKSAQMKAGLDQLEAVTGIDMRVIDRVVMGGVKPDLASASYNSPRSLTASEGIIILQGRFNARSLLALGKVAAGNKLVKQEHAGKSYYTFKINEALAKNSAAIRQTDEAALAVIDSRTIAFGTQAAIRHCLEAGKSASVANVESIKFIRAQHDAIISVALNLKSSAGFASNANQPSGKTARRGLDSFDLVDKTTDRNSSATPGGFDQMSRVMESIEKVYFSVGVSPANFDALLVARARTAPQAQELNDLLSSFKEMFANAIVKQPGNRSPFSDLQMSIEDNEVRVRVEINPDDMAALFAERQSPRGKAAASPARANRPARMGRRS